MWRPGYEGVMEQVAQRLGQRARERIILLDTPEYDISSTDIRARIRRQESLAGLVPQAVEQYIYRHDLYIKQEKL